MGLEERVEWGTARQMPTADEDFSLPSSQQLVKVNIACGQQKLDGFIGFDRVKTDAADIVHDVFQFPWPFESDSVYEFRCEHFVEHIPIQLPDGSYGLHRFMEEVWRCLMPGGTIMIVAPYYTSERAWQDPTHTRAITDITFTYYQRKYAEAMKVDHYAAHCNFEPVSRTYGLLPEWESRSDEARQWAVRHYFNVVADIAFVLRKVEL